MKKAKKLFFWFILCFLFPIFFILTVEMVLRLVDFGYSPSFLQTVMTEKGRIVRDNPFYFYRFFPSKLARTTGRFFFPKQKDEKVHRIFVFGSSAAMGDPDYSYSFSRMLVKMLQMKHPEHTFQVINTAATAINSHVVLPIVKECNSRQADLYIVLMGNNEVIGPYGPTTVLTPFSKHYNLVRFNIFLRSTKWSQIIDKVRFLFAGDPDELQEWGGMELFISHKIRANDNRLISMYKFFDNNLKMINKSASKNNIPIFLCTIPGNTTVWPPFFSLLSADLSDSQQEEWKKAFQAGTECEYNKKFLESAQFYHQAMNIDSSHAELCFRLARCELVLGNKEKARKHFIRARDMDALRFRVDSFLNNIIRQRAGDKNTKLVDLEQLFIQYSDSLADQDLFLDHVHYTLKGNYLIASHLFPLIEQKFSLPHSYVPNEQELRNNLCYTNWENKRLVQMMQQRFSYPPFTEQIEHKIKMENLQFRLDSIMQHIDPHDLHNAKICYETALAQFPDDWILYENYGKFLLSALHDPENAEKCFLKVLSFLPNDALTLNNLAAAQSHLKKWDTAESNLIKALDIMPNLTNAAMNLAYVFIENDKLEEAEKLLEKYALSNTVAADLHNSIGIRQAAFGNNDKAIQHFSTALKYDENFGQAHFNLGMIQKNQGDLQASINSLQCAVQLLPDQPKVYLELATVLRDAGRLDEAMVQYNRYLQKSPNDLDAHNDLGVLYGQSSHITEAIAEFRRVLEYDPQNLSALSNLAMTFSLTGKSKEAIALLKKITRFTNRPEFTYKIGLEFLKLDQPDSAEIYFSKVLALKLDFVPALEKLDSLKRTRTTSEN